MRFGQVPAVSAALVQLSQSVAFTQGFVTTTLPRGGLQVVQPGGVEAARTRLYVRDGHLYDLPAWQALTRRRPVRLSDLLHGGTLEGNAAVATVAGHFAEEQLVPFGLAHYAAVPLAGPVLDGYPGVLHLFRHADDGDFTGRELDLLTAFAADLDDAAGEMRRARSTATCCNPLPHRLRVRQLALRPGRQVTFPGAFPDDIDPVLRSNLLDVVDARLAAYEASAAPNGPGDSFQLDAPSEEAAAEAGTDDAARGRCGPLPEVSERLSVSDARGDAWTFRFVIFRSFPAMAGGTYHGPLAVVSLQPECDDWADLQPGDFAADEEIRRLIPALHFMHANYTSRTSLSEVARTVFLSPFHFHRRFTELLGITPKHYIFDCQISQAKRQLLSGSMDLASIARHCGFSHQSHFTSRFRQATHLTPTRWRKLARQAVDEAGA